MMKTILGVDPSFNRSGWALLQVNERPELLAIGTITPVGDERQQKLSSIFQQFVTVLATAQPSVVYLERPGVWQRKGGTRRETIEVLSMGRAAMILGCAQQGIKAEEVDVHVIRRTMFGHVNAQPEEIVRLVQAIGFGLPSRPRGGIDMDVCNAIVMCLYGRRALSEPDA